MCVCACVRACVRVCVCVCCYRLPNILEYLREPLQSGLGDRSAYVRKTAIMGIVKVFYVAPEFITGTQTNSTDKTTLLFSALHLFFLLPSLPPPPPPPPILPFIYSFSLNTFSLLLACVFWTRLIYCLLFLLLSSSSSSSCRDELCGCYVSDVARS